ncbi:helix-turn-helix domain-containing protein [Acrocarpospora catenulata]|uniref:helix-turn-helix domain-containing protein n=1 Tax=Acrocarpospora catenulata TaxID=2836182 RepID=UPI001BDA1245|nr:helix-turn-helix domain-containing protein [Acrocarpospora catenulata]
MVADPRTIRTRADLRTALQRLFHADGRPYLEVATAAKVSNSTLHDMVNGRSFPRWDTLRAVLAVCGISAGQMTAWQQAHARARPDRPASPGPDNRPGRPLEEMTDPFALEVHKPIQLDIPGPSALPVLPPYVPRAHDRQLGEVVGRTLTGQSGMAVLVGGSSTGKTRACWEALTPLRAAGGWRLWHPFDPTRPEAALAQLAEVGGKTVVWLNETQRYLDTPGDTGERVATALRTMLADSFRAPVLVLGTIWPDHWDVLTRDGNDRHAEARLVLGGTDIPITEGFAHVQAALEEAASTDARLAEALARAADREVTQYLAGVPELLARYRNAPPAAKAVIHAAMDARRMGHRHALSHALLEAAAPAYLTQSQWSVLSDDWLEQALAYTAALCKGVPGPVTRLRPRQTERLPAGTVMPVCAATTRDEGMPNMAGPFYQLADYLDQHGRRHRADQIPPIGFWAAVRACPSRRLGHPRPGRLAPRPVP